MENTQIIDDNLIDKVDKKYYETFFDTRKNYYISRLIDIEKGKKYTFNIGAFFFGLFWFIYRRLYIHAFLIFCFIIIESYLEQLLIGYYQINNNSQILINLSFLLVLSLFLGMNANNYFLKQSKKKVIRILDSTNDEETRIQKLEKAGKSNRILVLILVIAFIILMSIGF